MSRIRAVLCVVAALFFIAGITCGYITAMTNDERFGNASGVSAAGFFVAVVGVLFAFIGEDA